MPTDVLIPPLGQTVDTLTFVSWYRQEGDTVKAGEPLFVVETDKATLDVEAPASGVLRRITAASGDEVAALSAVAVIVAEGEGEGNSEELTGTQRNYGNYSRSSRSSEFPQVPPNSPSRIFASPRARRLAQREGVPIEAVPGSGPEGAVVERDVLAYVQAQIVERQRVGLAQLPTAGITPQPDEPAITPQPDEPTITPVARRMAEEAGLDWRQLSGSGSAGRITREDVERSLAEASGVPPVPPVPPVLAVTPAPDDILETIPLSGVRAVIAQRMAASHSQTAPVTLTTEADATGLVEARRRLVAHGVAVSYNDLLLAILAKALREHPRLNASLEGDEIKLWRRIDIGLAVDTERGLLAPVLRDLDQKGLRQIAAESRELAERAKAGQATPDELRGGTFTLTNLGMYGIDAFTPIINLPETAILGVGRIKQQAVWVEDHVEGRSMVWLSLTFDHRLVDGGPAARFLQAVVEYVEEPSLLLA